VRSRAASESQDDEQFFERMERHLPRTFKWTMRHLPSDPRCRLCNAPYGGFGGRIMRRFGFGPSRKNPTLCNTCFELAPMGGVDMEIGVLFADVRGFTAMSERMEPSRVAELLNRFYDLASGILSRSAIIDKLVGDEVMALYVPRLFAREGWEDEMLRDARELMTAVGYGSAEDPWLRLGIGLDIGRAFVGNVGSGEVKDFTAIGDVVNTASRLETLSKDYASQLVVSGDVARRAGVDLSAFPAHTVQIRGRTHALGVYVVANAAALEPMLQQAVERQLVAPAGS
jgi:adenylate cyclase